MVVLIRLFQREDVDDGQSNKKRCLSSMPSLVVSLLMFPLFFVNIVWTLVQGCLFEVVPKIENELVSKPRRHSLSNVAHCISYLIILVTPNGKMISESPAKTLQIKERTVRINDYLLS